MFLGMEVTSFKVLLVNGVAVSSPFLVEVSFFLLELAHEAFIVVASSMGIGKDFSMSSITFVVQRLASTVEWSLSKVLGELVS